MDHSLVSEDVMDCLVVAHGVAVGERDWDELELMIAALSDEDQDLVFEGIQTMAQDLVFRGKIAAWRSRAR